MSHCRLRIAHAHWHGFERFGMVLMSRIREASKVTVNSSCFHLAHQHYTTLMRLPRTQASLCKKTVMRIWLVYMKYCSGERWRRGWREECTWNARRLAVLGRFLATLYDFLQVVIFCCRLRFLATCFCWID
jgi:hypothetical protein